MPLRPPAESVPGIPRLNSSLPCVLIQLACLLPAGILNLFSSFELFVSLWPWNPSQGSAQRSLLSQVSSFFLLFLSENHLEHRKYSKKDKDYSQVSKSHKDTEKRSDKPAKCWLFPQTRVRIVSKDYKKGKYYNKKVLVFRLFVP